MTPVERPLRVRRAGLPGRAAGVRALPFVAAAAALAFVPAGPGGAAGARADADLGVANRTSVSGSLSPAGEIETFRVDVPRGTKVTVSVRGKRRREEAAASFDVAFFDPDGRDIGGSAAAGTSFRGTFEANATGEHRIVVTGATAGAYDLVVSWKGVKRFFGGGIGTFGIGAPRERGATGTFSAIAGAPGPQPQVVRERIDTAETQAFPAPPAGASRHVVSLQAAAVTADVTFDVADLAVSGTLIDTVFAPKPPKSKKRKLDLTQRNAGTGGEGSFVSGSVVDGSGGTVELPATGEIDGASVSIPSGALSLPTPVFVGTAPPFGAPNGAAGAGQAFSFGPGNVVFSSPVTITLSFDPAALVGGTESLQIFTLDEDGTVTLVPPPYTLDLIAGTVSFPASHFSSYRAFIRPPSRFDVTGDGIDDLVVAAPDKDGQRGAVYVFHGGAARSVPAELSASEADAVLFAPDAGARVGRALAVGDLDGDGVAEIVTSREPGTEGGQGAVLIFRGGPTLRRSLNRNEPALRFAPPGSDPIVGDAFAIGDLNGDALADLAVGTIGSGPSGQGRVFLVRMRAFDTITGPLGSDGVLGGSGTGDEFGHAITTGDMNGDRYPDLIVGAPQRQVVGGTGYVRRYGGSPTFFQNPGLIDPTIFSGTVADATFGHALAAGDADGDGRAELFVGAPASGPSATNLTQTGVFLFAGAASLTNRSDTSAESSLLGGGLDHFASSIAGLRTVAGLSLAIGAPDGPNGVTPPRNGRVTLAVVDGTGGFPVFAGTSLFDGTNANDTFGAVVRVLDWDGDGRDDLAVGAPGEDAGGFTDIGAVHVFFGPTYDPAFRVVIRGPEIDGARFGLR